MNLKCFSIFALGILSAGAALAQTGEMRGIVKDGSGARVPHAKVEITNAGTKAVRLADCNDQGLYTVAFLPPATTAQE